MVDDLEVTKVHLPSLFGEIVEVSVSEAVSGNSTVPFWASVDRATGYLQPGPIADTSLVLVGDSGEILYSLNSIYDISPEEERVFATGHAGGKWTRWAIFP